MASLRQIRQRMKSIDNIHEITKAMEMIASFRFKKAEGRFSRSRNYFIEMEKLLSSLSSSAEGLSEQLFEKKKVKKKALVVMTGDKGLCGAYNSNLLREAAHWLNQNETIKTFLVPVGKVGCDFFRKKNFPVLMSYSEKAMVDLLLAKKITADLRRVFLDGTVDSVELLVTTYKFGSVGRNRIVPYLGLSYLMERPKEHKRDVEYLYEPDLKTVLVSLLDIFLEGKIYMTLLESLTSECSARRMAMKQATDNAEDVLDKLRLLRNKTRQATITRELSEIVAGAGVLV